MTKIEKSQMKLTKKVERDARQRELDDLAIRTLASTSNKKLLEAAEDRIMRRLKNT